MYKSACLVEMTGQLPCMQVRPQSVITKLSVRFALLFMSAPSGTSEKIAIKGKYLDGQVRED